MEEGFGYPFLGGKEITQLAPKTEKFLSRPIHKARYEKELKVEDKYESPEVKGDSQSPKRKTQKWQSYLLFLVLEALNKQRATKVEKPLNFNGEACKRWNSR